MAGAAAIADLFGPPVVPRAETGGLSMAALRVAVGAPRDGELRALAAELGATRRAHADTIDALNAENRRLRRRLDISQNDLEYRSWQLRREQRRSEGEWAEISRNLARSADDIVRYIARAEVRMPGDIFNAIQLLRREGYDEPEEFTPDARFDE